MKLQLKKYITFSLTPPFFKKQTILDLSEQEGYGSLILYNKKEPVYYYSFLDQSENEVNELILTHKLNAFKFMDNVLKNANSIYTIYPLRMSLNIPIESEENFVSVELRKFNLMEILDKMSAQKVNEIINRSK